MKTISKQVLCQCRQVYTVDIDKTMHVNTHLMVQRMHKIKHAQKSLELVPGVNRVLEV